MKLSIITCMLAIVLGCGSPPSEPNKQVYGSVTPDTNPGNPPAWEDPFYEDPCNVGGQWVTVWVDGQPEPQWQPVICEQGWNPDRGDPAPFEGDPDPTFHNNHSQNISNGATNQR